MTEALWLLVHLKFSLNFIIQLSLWPWINKLQVSYHEFILHLRQIEPGMLPPFALQYPKNIQFKVSSHHFFRCRTLGIENRLWGGSKDRTADYTHIQIQMVFLWKLKSMPWSCITPCAGKTALFAEKPQILRWPHTGSFLFYNLILWFIFQSSLRERADEGAGKYKKELNILKILGFRLWQCSVILK